MTDVTACSFDIVRDSLGAPRSAFPHTAYLMAGTQAAPGNDNYISVMKMAELSQGEHGKVRRTLVQLVQEHRLT